MEKLLFVSLLTVYFLLPVSASRIKIVNNGYEDILISLDPKTAPRNRTFVIAYLQNVLEEASAILQTSTKGRAYFRSATFIVPRTWGGIRTWYSRADNSTPFEDAGASLNRADADIVVTSSKTNDFSYTLHQGGCGRPALRVYLPENHLLNSQQKLNSRDFARLWAEFRYGIFPEGGFQDDEKYPQQFESTGGENKTTECRNEPKRLSEDCVGADICEKECKDECEVECDTKCTEKCERECKVEPVVSSLADQHLPNSAILFCEGRLSLGPNHDPSSPSKHNLLCNEEGTWFTVLRSPDFKHGKNAAPRHNSDLGMTFSFVREVELPRVVVALDVSSRMKEENRYSLTRNAFSHFVTTLLLAGSELNLLTFGGNGNSSSLITSALTIGDEESRIRYLESQPLPEEPTSEESPCLDCVLEDILELVEGVNSSFSSAPIVILLTTTEAIADEKYNEIELRLLQSKMRLMAVAFEDKYESLSSSLYELCSNTDSQYLQVGKDLLKDLYGAFGQAISGHNSRQTIAHKHLISLDEENIFYDFYLDKSVSKQLQISISGPSFSSPPLEYANTKLVSPTGRNVMPRKREIVPSWDFQISNPQSGVYTLKTRRKFGSTSPVVVSVYGTPTSSEEPITARVWIEIVEYKVSPPPVLIFAEVRKGSYPIRNATVVAYVHHPQNGGISDITLLDDGYGNVDITEDDGVYSHYFTNFTSTGSYNVYVEITGGYDDYSEVLKGPSSDCCGSAFSANEHQPIGRFQREAGPVTFQVTSLPVQDDAYPPAKVTDLRISKVYDQIVALRWTAVGDDFDTGVAAKYELKLFRNRSLIRKRFSNSELYSDVVETTPLAEYGVTLHHLLDIPKLERGLYYLGIRALDEAGNPGEPSNAVPLWIEGKRTVIQCTDDQPTTDKLTSGNGASRNLVSFIFIFVLICIHL